MGRVSYLADSDGTQLVDYYYLGLEPDRRRELRRSRASTSISAKRTAPANWTDVDQFNRATDMVFAEIGGGANLDEIQYGYDVSGNDLWRGPSRPRPATARPSTSFTATTP